MRIVAIIQARMGSTRLPGKVLKDLCGRTVLAWVVNRTRRAKLVDEVVVATTVKPEDDVIVAECDRLLVAHFRGDEVDVLDRYYRAAKQFSADAVVRVTSDCPLIDPDLIDEHVRRLISTWHEVDFITNMVRQTFPLGLAVEAMPMDVLSRMKRMSQTDVLKEHVTTLLYAEPELFRVAHVQHSEDLSHLRWTVDVPEDLQLVRLIAQHFGNDRFAWQEILPVLGQHPSWCEINQAVPQKVV